MAIGVRKRRPPRGLRLSDRSTVALAVLAVGSLGTVLGGELLRLARRRRESAHVPTPDSLLDAAGLATRDVVAVARQGYGRASGSETRLFNLLNGFVGAFALARLSTLGIRYGWWPTGNVRLGNRHIHHFVPGIVLAFFCGGAAIATPNERLEQALAFGYGAGVGLTFDEAALLLDLRDVYWTREGVLSVQVSLGLTAVLAATIMGLRMLRRGERQSIEAGLIPPIVHDTDALAVTGAIG
jgi:hypothetical protein